VYCEDAFDFLNKNTKKYNLIIIDPPPFAKTKREKEGAIKGLQYLVINSIKSLENETGYIALFSCSHHISLEDLNRVLLFSSLKTKKKIEIIEHLYQDIDHPYILNIPNSLYLKGYLIKVE
jgi:23S rRNA (cytosine1962-C5)-methyltransferase